jgi:malate dehydrogenase (oxaloacetate-decarboxylating)
LNAAYITPSVFHSDVHSAVATAVRRAAGGPADLPTDTEVTDITEVTA